MSSFANTHLLQSSSSTESSKLSLLSVPEVIVETEEKELEQTEDTSLHFQSISAFSTQAQNVYLIEARTSVAASLRLMLTFLTTSSSIE